MPARYRIIAIAVAGCVASLASPCFAQRSVSGICWTHVPTNGRPGTTTTPFEVELSDDSEATWKRYEAEALKVTSVPVMCSAVTDAQGSYRDKMRMGYASFDFHPALTVAGRKTKQPHGKGNSLFGFCYITIYQSNGRPEDRGKLDNSYFSSLFRVESSKLNAGADRAAFLDGLQKLMIRQIAETYNDADPRMSRSCQFFKSSGEAEQVRRLKQESEKRARAGARIIETHFLLGQQPI